MACLWGFYGWFCGLFKGNVWKLFKGPFGPVYDQFYGLFKGMFKGCFRGCLGLFYGMFKG